MKYLIIDDEHISHHIIKGYCDLLDDMELVKQCYDAIEALSYVRKHKVDLIFLDLNMPKLNGFDFLRTLPNPPQVIVTTAYKEYALEGYELNIIDYLLKPFSFERFVKAIHKVKQLKIDSAPLPATKKEEGQYVFLYSDKKHIQVKVNEILFVEAAGNYCKVVLNGTQLLVREKISDLVEMLSAEAFIQVHKSYMVSKKNIESLEGNRIYIQGHQIPIGKLYKKKVFEFLKL